MFLAVCYRWVEIIYQFLNMRKFMVQVIEPNFNGENENKQTRLIILLKYTKTRNILGCSSIESVECIFVKLFSTIYRFFFSRCIELFIVLLNSLRIWCWISCGKSKTNQIFSVILHLSIAIEENVGVEMDRTYFVSCIVMFSIP